MKSKKMYQFRLAHLLWVTLVVAAFLSGYMLRDSQSQSADEQVISFYVNVLR